MLLQCCESAAQVVKCSCGQKLATNCNDLGIAQVISCTIICVTCCIVIGFLLWKLMDHIAKRCQEKRQRGWEIEDKQLKQEADKKQRAWQIEDMKFQMLKELCYSSQKEKNEKQEKVLKELESAEVGKYLSELEGTIDNLKTIING